MYLVSYAQTAPYSLHQDATRVHRKKTERYVHFSCSILLLYKAYWLLLFYKVKSVYILKKSVSQHILKGVK